MTRARSVSKRRSIKGKSNLGIILRQPCRYYLKGTCSRSLCENWHPPECQCKKNRNGVAREMGSPRHVPNRRRRTRVGPEPACVQTLFSVGVAHAVGGWGGRRGRANKNTKFEEIQSLFNITQILILEHSGEIVNVHTIHSSSQSRTRSVLCHDQMIQWTKAKVLVYSDPVLRLEHMNDGKDAIIRWEGQLGKFKMCHAVRGRQAPSILEVCRGEQARLVKTVNIQVRWAAAHPGQDRRHPGVVTHSRLKQATSA